MQKAAWNIKNRLKARLAIAILSDIAIGLFLGFYVHWIFFLLIALNVPLTYLNNKKSKEKYLIGVEEQETHLVLSFTTPGFKTGTDILAKNDLTFIEMSRAGILSKFPMELNLKYQGEWQTYKLLRKEMTQFLAQYAAAYKSGLPNGA